MMQLEDACHLLSLTAASRTRGRKPNGYIPLATIKDVVMFALDRKLQWVGATGEDQKK
jgi:hypothetical protein